MTDAFAATVTEKVSAYSAEKNKIKEKPWPVQPQRQTDSRHIRTHPHDSMLRSERAASATNLQPLQHGYAIDARLLDCSTVRLLHRSTLRCNGELYMGSWPGL